MTTSTIEYLALPDSDDAWAGWLHSRCDDQLAVARSTAAELSANPHADPNEVLARWNDIAIALGNAMAAASLLPEVHPDEATSAPRPRRLGRRPTAWPPSSPSTGVCTTSLAGVDRRQLDDDAIRVLDLRSPRLPPGRRRPDESTRQRLREINERETVLGQDFARAIRDDTRHVRIEPERLAGLPDDFIAAHPPTTTGMVTITTEYPDAFPVPRRSPTTPTRVDR